jgi:hypothetical protein
LIDFLSHRLTLLRTEYALRHFDKNIRHDDFLEE